MSTVSSTGTERLNRLSNRYQIGIDSGGGLGQDAAGVHAGLFEHILSLSVPLESHASRDDYSPVPEPAAYQDSEAAESSVSSDQRVNDSADEDNPVEENADAAASVLVVDQALPVVVNNDQTPEMVELVNHQAKDQASTESEDATDEVASIDGESTPQTLTPVNAPKNRDPSQAQDSDQNAVVVENKIDDQHEQGQQQDELLTPKANTKKRDDDGPSLEVTDFNAGEPQEESAKIVSQSDGDKNTELASAETLATEKVANTGASDERRDPRERREKWFERDTSQQTITGADGNQREPQDIVAQELEPAATANREALATAPPQPAIAPTTAEENVFANVDMPQADSAAAAIAASLDGLQSTPASSDAALSDRSSTGVEGVTRGAERRATSTTPAKSQAPGDSVDLSQQERVRLVQRVARSFARLGPEGGQINLRLHPPQLGSLNVQVRLEGRSMTANLTTESSAARDVIMESLPVLRSRLAEMGFEISQFQVDVAANGSDASQSSNSDPNYDPNSNDRDSSFANSRPTRSAIRSDENQPGPRLSRDNLMWQTTTGIDVHA